MTDRTMKHRLALSLVLIGALLAAQPLVRADAPTPDPARWEKAMQQFAEQDRHHPPGDGAILFVGSSSIRMWKTAESFPQYDVINRGFGGSQSPDVLYYMDRIVLPYNACAIVYYEGDNDIATGRSAQQVADDFAEFMHRLREHSPDTPLLYLPIKPSGSRWEYWPEMEKANKMIKDQCDHDEHLYYVETAAPLLGEDGKPQADLFLDDSLHLNDKGYALWNNIVTPLLEKLCPPAKATTGASSEASSG